MRERRIAEAGVLITVLVWAANFVVVKAAIDVLGPEGLRVGNFFERLYRVSPLMRFGGGTNEVLRDVIAQRGHTMPSYGR